MGSKQQRSPRVPHATSLRTPWADAAIGAEHPLPEYPRPMLERSEWASLNGAWEYAIRSLSGGGAGDEAPEPQGYEGSITVPFAIETVASGVTRLLAADEHLVYRRVFAVPPAWQGRRVALNFEAVDYEASVWVNGAKRGVHRGGYEPFTIDAGTAAELEIVVVVHDPGPGGGQQYGKQSDTPGGIWYTATSGIWGSVWAEPLPNTAITYVTAHTHADRGGFDVLVETDASGGASGGAPGEVTVAVALPDGGELTVTGAAGHPIPVALESPRLWSVADPYRYALSITAGGDTVQSWAGVRTVELGPAPGVGVAAGERDFVLLNGEPIFINSVLDQGYWPESGLTAPSDAALIFDLEQLKALGFNSVRKHIKLESRRFYDHADRLGILIIQDIVNGGKPRVSINQSAAIQVLDQHFDDTSRGALAAAGRSSKTNRAEFEADVANTVRLLDPHASVVCWTLFNEAWGQYDTDRLEGVLRGLDSSRLIDAASGWYDQGGGDFRSRHRYKLRLKKPPAKDRRPYFVSEFGGHNLAAPGHMWEASGKFGYKFHSDTSKLNEGLDDLWRAQLIPLVAHGLRACVYTQVSDVETESNGLFTYDRRLLKPSAELMREVNAELYAAFAAVAGAG